MAPKPGSRAARRIEAPDARADERRRVVLAEPRARRDRALRATACSCASRCGRAPMPASALSVAGLDEAGFRYEVRLIHRGPRLQRRCSARSYEQCRSADRLEPMGAFRRSADAGRADRGRLRTRASDGPERAARSEPDRRRRRRGVGRPAPALSDPAQDRPARTACAPVVFGTRIFPGWRARAHEGRRWRPGAIAAKPPPMRQDVLYALVLFCFVSGVTPGPNNLMLMSSGVNFGFRRTLPHLPRRRARLFADGRADRRRARRDLHPISESAADHALGRRRLICSGSRGRLRAPGRCAKANPAASRSASSAPPPSNGSTQRPG